MVSSDHKPHFISRTLEPALRRAANEFPVVVLTGPRQAGKTTLLQHVFANRYRYVSLEPPDVRGSAEADPRGFLATHAPPVIFDEVQYAPDLLIYIKEAVDRQRDWAGQYLLTGSQNLLLLERVSESLAGRTAMLRLLPLSQREVDEAPTAPLPWEVSEESAVRTMPTAGQALWQQFLRGYYPELAADPDRDAKLWYGSYMQTYLERDVRTVRAVGDLTQYQAFLRALAARSAQLLSLSDLARDLGLAVNTVRAWLSVLEATHQIILLRPYYANIGKRLVKTPKVYFLDVGTLCYLTGLKDPEHAAAGPMAGAILETAVVAEVFKTLVHRAEEPRLSFWRTATGVEVDLLVEVVQTLYPLEVKLSATPNPRMASSIMRLRQDLGFERVAAGYIVHPGETILPLGPDARAWPFGGL